MTVGAWLLSVRAADAPGLDDLRGSWVPQVAAARGDDVGAPDRDDTWWLSLIAQPTGSRAEAAA